MALIYNPIMFQVPSYSGSKIGGLGGRGEDVVALYLSTHEYRIIDRNYRTKYGEIDIIAQDHLRTLVFVEVKTVSQDVWNITPEDNLSNRKLYKLQRICRFFANAHPELSELNGWQIDLVAVIAGSKNYKIKHYKNI